MSRYRKMDVRMWGDEKFRRLSPLPPCGQGLWIYLLTNPSTGTVPGLYSAGRAHLAEELDWSLEAFDKAFAEARSQGMVKADWKARLIWVPNAIEYNKPESPNVVKSWAIPFDELPECALKAEAIRGLRAFVEGMGEAFQQAFEKAWPKTMANQEQEQEQEQDQNSTHRAREESLPPPPLEGSPEHFALLAVCAFQERLTTLSMHDHRSWLDDWAWIGARPKRERTRVIATLARSAWAQKNWHKCTPRHIRRHWQAYASSLEPGMHGAAPANDNGRRAGPSEVGKPEDFDEGLPT